MSWVQKLYETYNHCENYVGIKETPKSPVLLPVYHITQQAHIEVWIDSDGNWCKGRSLIILDKSEATTILPCTEASAGAANGRAPHPLFDKLRYLAGDYVLYGGEEKNHQYQEYIEALSRWCDSPFCSPKVKSVLLYLRKGTLIRDLVEDGLLICGNDNKLLNGWKGDKESAPPIFKVPNLNDQREAFIRFCVIPTAGASSDSFNSEIRLWRDRDVWKSFIDYQDSLPQDYDICYALGKKLPVSRLSPKKIRNAGDSAKLISGNDEYGFTFRGRFLSSRQAACISREATEKAHSALRWLIARQGGVSGDQAIVSWNIKKGSAMNVTADSVELLQYLMPEEPVPATGEAFSRSLAKAAAGYGSRLDESEDAVVMVVDSATPGRLSITYYRELPEKELVERVMAWHTSCSWLQRYRRIEDGVNEKGKTIYRNIEFIGAPAPKDIAEAAYGSGCGDKLKKATIERILPCIVDGSPIPPDIVHSAVRRASNPQSMDVWEYRKQLGISCALVKKYLNDKYNSLRSKKHEAYKEVWKMALDKGSTNRDYLFGRLLAYAHNIESYAMYVSGGDSRQTNAERLMHQFTLRPSKTWDIIKKQLVYYLRRLGENDLSRKWKLEMNEIEDKIGIENFNNNKLSEVYLIGYASQMMEFENEKAIAKEKKGEK